MTIALKATAFVIIFGSLLVIGLHAIERRFKIFDKINKFLG